MKANQFHAVHYRILGAAIAEERQIEIDSAGDLQTGDGDPDLERIETEIEAAVDYYADLTEFLVSVFVRDNERFDADRFRAGAEGLSTNLRDRIDTDRHGETFTG